MQAQDVISLARPLLGDPSTNGRWSQATLLVFVDRASKIIGRDVEFPESRFSTTTVTNEQEYALPPTIKTYRCYMAGQLLVPTTLQVLEGHQIEQYDQGPNAASPLDPTGTQGQTPGSGGPPGTAGPYSPSWNIQSPETYPVANSWQGSPAPDAQPWYAGQRPRFYTRGGVIGLVPAPAGAYELVLDVLRVPDTIVAVSQPTVYPDNFVDAMAWKVVELAKFSEGDDRSMAARDYARSQYMYEMRNLRVWRKKYYLGDAPAMPKLLYRAGINVPGNNRLPGGWTGYP